MEHQDTPKAGAEKLAAIDLGELLSKEFAPREPIISPWLRQKETAMVWAPTGVGKTWFVLTLALLAAGGGSVMGWSNPTPRRVLFIDGEMAVEDLQERSRLLLGAIDGIDAEAAKANLRFLPRSMQGSDVRFPDMAEREADGRPGGQEVILRAARDHGAELVVLDNFTTLADVRDENDAAATKVAMHVLMRLKQDKRAAILVHHSGKGKNAETFRGSSAIAATFEVIVGLTRPDEASIGAAAFTTLWQKVRAKADASLTGGKLYTLRTGDDGLVKWEVGVSPDAEAAEAVRAVKSGRFSSQRQAAASLGWNDSRMTRAKKRAIAAGMTTKAQWDACLAADSEGEEDVVTEF
jgi:hypothetical protein